MYKSEPTFKHWNKAKQLRKAFWNIKMSDYHNSQSKSICLQNWVGIFLVICTVITKLENESQSRPSASKRLSPVVLISPVVK